MPAHDRLKSVLTILRNAQRRASRAVSQQQYHLPNVLRHRTDLDGSLLI
jgi:hypothetical protein